MKEIVFGKGKEHSTLQLNLVNRHGMIAGATGTGKTITLKVLAEELSQAGVPVFLADVKGDLASLAEPGEINDNVQKRLEALGLTDFEPRGYEVEFYDVYGQNGLPVRTTISEMGPILLSRLLGLNDVQEGILNIVFKVADEDGLLLIDTKDLRAMLNYVKENRQDLERRYGTVNSQSVGAIQRGLLVLEEQGGDKFFGEPDFDVMDFLRRGRSGEGVISVLASDKLFLSPKLYSTFLLWLLSELYERLPEVGDLDAPKLVFFFDEAHLLFNDANKALIEKIELITRLIRSKGVGVFYVTQNPIDVPESVTGQLANRIQHSLRAYTPKEQRAVRAVADTFRQDGSIDVVEAITNLKTGEALVSTLDEESKPTFVQQVTIYPPHSKIGVIDPQMRLSIINDSSIYDKYQEAIDRESAYEKLTQQQQSKAEMAQRDALQQAEQKVAETVAKKTASAPARRTDSAGDRFVKNIFGSVGRELGRQITRGVMGIFKNNK